MQIFTRRQTTRHRLCVVIGVCLLFLLFVIAMRTFSSVLLFAFLRSHNANAGADKLIRIWLVGEAFRLDCSLSGHSEGACCANPSLSSFFAQKSKETSQKQKQKASRIYHGTKSRGICALRRTTRPSSCGTWST